MHRKIIYIINPIAGTQKKINIEALIREQTAKQHILFDIVYTNPLGDYEYLVEKISTEKFTDIVGVGGDGTFNHIVSSLKHLPVQFGILPCGSGNSLAFAAGISKKINTALKIIFDGYATYIDGFSINNQFSCVLTGLGFDAQIAHNFSTKSKRGLLTYIHQSVLHFFKAKPYLFKVQTDGFSFFTEAFFISIANSNQFGNQFTIAPKASLSDGLLDIVIAQKMSKVRLPFAIMHQVKGYNQLQQFITNDVAKKNIIYFQTPTLTIYNTQSAPLHIDGEPHKTEKIFDIRVIKNCFKLIQPLTSINVYYPKN